MSFPAQLTGSLLMHSFIASLIWVGLDSCTRLRTGWLTYGGARYHAGPYLYLLSQAELDAAQKERAQEDGHCYYYESLSSIERVKARRASLRPICSCRP